MVCAAALTSDHQAVSHNWTEGVSVSVTASSSGGGWVAVERASEPSGAGGAARLAVALSGGRMVRVAVRVRGVPTGPVQGAAAAAGRAAGPTLVPDVVVTVWVAALARLAMYGGGLRTSAPPGFW